MPQLRVGDVDVDFPKDPPYPCQVEYMKKCISALNTGANALLESPTGTGKTLCLLCSTLAWQYQQQNMVKKHNEPKPREQIIEKSRDPMSSSGSGGSVIIYATRTHSQLTQVVSELKSTAYRPNMTVLGSREQLCVHEKISKLKGAILNHACNTLSSKRSCMYKNNLDSYQGVSSSSNPSVPKQSAALDVEDLVKMGRSEKVCPYFHTRDMSTKADLVLLPYNYLLDSSIRNTLKLKWENAVIIFDEAHNLERVASDAASCSLSSTDIAACIKELQQVLSILQNMGDYSSSGAADSATAGGASSAEMLGSRLLESSELGPPNMQNVTVLLRAMFELEKSLDKLTLNKDGHGQTPSAVLPGGWIQSWFETSGLPRAMNRTYLIELKRCAMLLVSEAENALGGFDAAIGGGGAPMALSEPKLSTFVHMYERIIQAVNRSLWNDYKCFICEEESGPGGKWAKPASPAHVSYSTKTIRKRVVNFWSFSPGIALEELKSLRVRSIILTSGTLSPMESLKEDMKIAFTVQLENPHVIDRNQLWVGAVGRGLSNVAFNSTYGNRNSNEYKDELGISILHVCLTMYGNKKSSEITLAKSGLKINHAIIPSGKELKGGILVFFPSYTWMDSLIERWKSTGVLEQLRLLAGHIIVEPKSSASKSVESVVGSKSEPKTGPGSFMTGTVLHSKPMHSFGDTRKGDGNEKADGDDVMKGLVGQFDSVIAKHGTCILFAVCRGKVSEGIDFTDNKGRVVIITGIPFAPSHDAWVMLKKQYLDERCAGTTEQSENSHSMAVVNSSSHPRGMPTMSGEPINIWRSAMNGPPTTAHAVSTVKPKRSKSTLTGQGWYTQSASRAVNQCLGRIIRHKNDWGAVFLLDDRFQNEQQTAQLSSWVKPQLQKYPQIPPALSSFREFITNCMNNPKLMASSTSISEEADTRKHSNSLVGIPRSRPSGDIKITRHVEVSQDLLGTDGDITYVDPALLMTQASSTGPTMTSVVNRPANMLKRSNSGSETLQTSEAQLQSVDLAGVFKRITNKSMIIPRDPAFDTSKVANPPIETRKEAAAGPQPPKTIAHYFGLQAQPQQQQQSFSSGNDSKVKEDAVSGKGPSKKDDNAKSIDPKGNTDILKRAADLGDRRLTSSHTMANSKMMCFPNPLHAAAAAAPRSQSSSLSGIETLRQLIADLKKILKPETFNRFREEVLRSKDKGITIISEAKQFLERLLDILADLDVNTKLCALLTLSCVMPSGLVETFTRLAEAACTSSCDPVNKKTAKANTLTTTTATTTTVAATTVKTASAVSREAVESPESSVPLSQSEAGASKFGSKRARLMVDSCMQGRQVKTSTSTSFLSGRMEEVGRLSLLQPKNAASSSSASSSSSLSFLAAAAPVPAMNRTCGICKTVATEPVVARCGHVCCNSCWSKLLKIKPSCPFCNAAVSADQLRKLKIKV